MAKYLPEFLDTRIHSGAGQRPPIPAALTLLSLPLKVQFDPRRIFQHTKDLWKKKKKTTSSLYIYKVMKTNKTLVVPLYSNPSGNRESGKLRGNKAVGVFRVLRDF